MNGTIKETDQRPGIVTAISPGEVTVQIQQQSACSQCHARDWCVSTECKDRYLQLKTHGRSFSIGVVARTSVGRLAVLLAFVLPLLLLVAAVALGQSLLQLSEGGSVALALGVLTLYYLLLYSQRQRLGRRLTLRVESLAPHHE